jgi:type VI secretion system secreted protein Hcp
MKIRKFFTKRIAIAAAAAIAIASVALPGLNGMMNGNSVSADGTGGGYYLQLGDVKGSSKDEGHENWINLLSVSQSITRPTGASTGSVRVRSGAQFGDIVTVKEVDASTPKLQEAIADGTVFPRVEIQLTSSDGGRQQPYLMWELKNVRISSYSINGSADGNSIPVEEISLNFEEIKVTYSDNANDGSSKGNVEYTWKVEEGVK